jgi:hypothetical protein
MRTRRECTTLLGLLVVSLLTLLAGPSRGALVAYYPFDSMFLSFNLNKTMHKQYTNLTLHDSLCR